VEDDFPRKIIAHDVRPDETAFSLSHILEMRLESAPSGRALNRERSGADALLGQRFGLYLEPFGREF